MADDDVMMPPAPPTPAEVLAAEIDAVVAAMVASRWPTTPAEFAVWADEVGLFRADASSPEGSAAPHPLGKPEPELDEWAPGSRRFHAPGHPWMLSWHFRDDEFVGVAMFPGADLDPVELRRLGLALRDRFDARWEAAESLHDAPPLTGFASFWLTGVCSVDLYWHAPRVDPFGDASSGAVQLAVSHDARSRAEDDEAAARMTRGD